MCGTLKSSLILVALAAWGSTAAFADSGAPQKAPPFVTVFTCKGLKTIEVVNSDNFTFTNSQTYIDLPGASTHFDTNKPGCVLVTFTAPSQTFDNIIAVRMVGSGFSCLPDSSNNLNLFADPDSTDEGYANSMTYICPNVPAGRHGIQAQWRTYFSTPNATLYGFTMTVAHR